MTDKPSIEEINVNGAQVWVKSDNPHLKQFIIEAVRDHGEDPGYFPKAPTESRSPDVIDRGSDDIQHRFAKETIGMAAVQLNLAYSDFSIDWPDVLVPSGRLQEASRHLSHAMHLLGVNQPKVGYVVDAAAVDDEIPF